VVLDFMCLQVLIRARAESVESVPKCPICWG